MNEKELLRNLLLKEGYLMVNKTLLHILGIEAAILISDLLSKERYFENADKVRNGWFFNTVKNRKEDTGLSDFQQRNVIKKIVEKRILEVKRKGVPARQYFKINHPLLLNILSCSYKETKQLELKKLNNINNKNNINKNESIINNTCKDSSNPSKVFKTPFTERCILGWNRFPFTQKMRVTAKTKTIEKTERYIQQLLKGTFLSSRGNKSYDTEWFKQNKIPLKLKKLTKREILVAIKSTSLYSEEGYFPENKTHIPKDLATLMYNPRTGKSWFLKAYHSPPKPLFKEKTINNPDTHAVKYLISILNGKFDVDSMNDKVKLFRGVKTVCKFVESIPQESMRVMKIRGEVGTPLRMYKCYVDWLLYQSWLDGASLPILNTENKVWKKFIKEKEDEYQGYKLQ